MALYLLMVVSCTYCRCSHSLWPIHEVGSRVCYAELGTNRRLIDETEDLPLSFETTLETTLNFGLLKLLNDEQLCIKHRLVLDQDTAVPSGSSK